MEDVKAHLVAVWAADGLECRAVGSDYIHGHVAPRFPIGAFCADMAETFNAEVESRVDASGLLLVITKDVSTAAVNPRAGDSWCRCLLLGAAAVCPVVAYGLTTHETLQW